MLFTQLYVKVDILLTSESTCVTASFQQTGSHVIKVAVLSQESERKCICYVTGIEIASSFEFSIGFLICFVVLFLFFMVMGLDLVGSFKLRQMVT